MTTQLSNKGQPQSKIKIPSAERAAKRIFSNERQSREGWARVARAQAISG